MTNVGANRSEDNFPPPDQPNAARWEPSAISLYQQSFVISPRPGPRRIFAEPPSPQLLWRLIERTSEIKELTAHRFGRSTAENATLWAALRGVVIQARQYFNAAQATEGPSASLLHYYCFLNLAKAELLLSQPSAVFEPDTGAVKRLHHGLSYNPSLGSSFETDAVRVLPDGIFPLLYEKRVGAKPQFDSLQVVDLLRYVPELATDLEDIGRFGRTSTGSVVQAVLRYGTPDGSDLRCLSLMRLPTVTPDPATAAFLLHHHSAVSVTQEDAKRIFGKKGNYALLACFAESMGSIAIRSKTTIYLDDADTVEEMGYNGMREILDVNGQTGEYDVIAPSLRSDDFQALPCSLASYALMFYVSSLVRYKPYQLYSETNGLERWLLNAYVEQAPTRLLLSALNGVSGDHNVFAPSDAVTRGAT